MKFSGSVKCYDAYNFQLTQLLKWRVCMSIHIHTYLHTYKREKCVSARSTKFTWGVHVYWLYYFFMFEYIHNKNSGEKTQTLKNRKTWIHYIRHFSSQPDITPFGYSSLYSHNCWSSPYLILIKDTGIIYLRY